MAHSKLIGAWFSATDRLWANTEFWFWMWWWCCLCGRYEKRIGRFCTDSVVRGVDDERRTKDDVYRIRSLVFSTFFLYIFSNNRDLITYGHRLLKTRLPVRSAKDKPQIG